MPTFTETHARQSDDAYRRDEFKPPHPYEIWRVVETPSGYRGIIYKNTETSEYVVAHTGREFDTDKIRDGLITDVQVTLLKVPQPLDDTIDTITLKPALSPPANRPRNGRLQMSVEPHPMIDAKSDKGHNEQGMDT